MFYIHQSSCISHQPTFTDVDLEDLKESTNNRLYAIEPKYAGIPPGQLRRMGRAVRMGVGSGMALLMQNKVDGIIIGTANGGIEDSIQFLKQIVDYDEGRLTATSFVQSTYNAIAGVMGMMTSNKGYNSTHVYRGLAFENVMLDAIMLLRQHPERNYLIGGVDEISDRNHQLEWLDGWYKKKPVLNSALYETDSVGTLPGEGAAVFIVNNSAEGAVAKLAALKMLHTDKEEVIVEQLNLFLKENGIDKNSIDLFLTGENGDNRMLNYFTACEGTMYEKTSVARYKHMTGEFQTASALSLWLSSHFLKTQTVPKHLFKKGNSPAAINRILIYNNYKGVQHSFMLVEKVE